MEKNASDVVKAIRLDELNDRDREIIIRLRKLSGSNRLAIIAHVKSILAERHTQEPEV